MSSTNVPSIWSSGLSAAGKSTLSRALVTRLRQGGYPTALIDGDEMRQILGGQLGYDLPSRRKQTTRVMRLARWLGQQEILSVVAIVHPCEADRRECRRQIEGYFEVHLECPLAICVRRDPKRLYEEALSGRRQHVVGVDIPYDPPRTVDLRLRSDTQSVEELLGALWQRLAPALSRTVIPESGPAMESV